MLVCMPLFLRLPAQPSPTQPVRGRPLYIYNGLMWAGCPAGRDRDSVLAVRIAKPRAVYSRSRRGWVCGVNHGFSLAVLDHLGRAMAWLLPGLWGTAHGLLEQHQSQVSPVCNWVVVVDQGTWL